jgi:ribonuclease Y
MTPVIVGIVALVVGAAAGFLIRTSMARSSAHSIEAQAQSKLVLADQRLSQAEQESAQTLRTSLQDAKTEAAQIRKDAEDDVRARREEISRLEGRIGDADADIRSRTE